MIGLESIFMLAVILATAVDLANLTPLFLRIVEQHPKHPQAIDIYEEKVFQKLEQVWNKLHKVGTTFTTPDMVIHSVTR